MRLRTTVSSFVVARLTVAATVGYFDSDSCADPSGFATCYDNADSSWADCINNNCNGLGIDCHNACECVRQESYLNCAASSCWNRVYSCEYQSIANDLLTYCRNPPLDGLPFFPPPDNAPGGCACNIGKVSVDVSLASLNVDNCNSENVDNLTSVDDVTAYLMGCQCCGYSALLSALPNTCPRLNPAELDIDNLEQSINQASGSDWRECASYLENFDCVQTFGYPADIDTYYGPGEIPTGGTETLHNTAGSITTPMSGETFTWTFGTIEHVITVASPDAFPTGTIDQSSTDASTTTSRGAAGNDNGATSQPTATDETQPGLGIHGASIHPLLIAVVVGVIPLLLVL